jgi:hypothetical protein
MKSWSTEQANGGSICVQKVFSIKRPNYCDITVVAESDVLQHASTLHIKISVTRVEVHPL